jgi:DNA-binding MarR family transcriptional regulator
MPALNSERTSMGAASAGGAGDRARRLLDLERYVPALLDFVANKMSSSAGASYRKLFGIGVIEWRCLSLIALEPWLAPQRLCQVIGLDKAAASRSVAKLRGKGLVQARPNALRSRFLELALTQEGQRVHDRIIVIAHGRERRLLGSLSQTEVDVLIGALHKMLGSIPGTKETLVFAKSLDGDD